jgi:putative SOS response-associated peptidase YedK
MCGRYTTKEQRAIERELAYIDVVRWPDLEARYNISPTQAVPVVRWADGVFEGTMMRWGLVPYFARGVAPKYSTINARIESIQTAPAYRGPWKRAQRCVLPASGFYEWHLSESGARQPFYIHLADQEVFGFAGLWDRSIGPNGPIESCTLITMPANALLSQIHNVEHRMPAILKAADHATWLQGDAMQARQVLLEYPADTMVAWPVSTRVNAPRNDGPALIEPVTVRQPPTQSSLL